MPSQQVFNHFKRKIWEYLVIRSVIHVMSNRSEWPAWHELCLMLRCILQLVVRAVAPNTSVVGCNYKTRQLLLVGTDNYHFLIIVYYRCNDCWCRTHNPTARLMVIIINDFQNRNYCLLLLKHLIIYLEHSQSEKPILPN